MRVVDVRRSLVEDAVEEAARAIFRGGRIVYADETGYLLACDVLQNETAESIYRDAPGSGAHDVAVCVATAAELLEYAYENQLAAVAVRRLLPEPVAFVIPCPSFWTRVRAGSRNVALRVPADPFARALLDRCGPLVVCATQYDGFDLEGLPVADVLLERGEVVPRLEASVVDLTGERARLVVEASASYDRLAARFGTLEDMRSL